jgi:hypothetical protein
MNPDLSMCILVSLFDRFNEQVASAGWKNLRWHDFNKLQNMDCGIQRTEQSSNSKNHQRQSDLDHTVTRKSTNELRLIVRL